MKDQNGRLRPVTLALALLGLASLVVAAYLPALDNQLLRTWDTWEYVIDNPQIRALRWENIQWMLTDMHLFLWHPLTWLSHAIDYQLFGLNPTGHHAVNVVLHLLCTWLVFLLALETLERGTRLVSALPKDVPPTFVPLGALLAAALFGVHPQHVESVAWVAERKDVLCLFFSLLCLSFYFRYTRTTSSTRFWWFTASLLAFMLALMSKPMAVTLPVILLLFDVYPLGRTTLIRRDGFNASTLTALLVEKLPFIALSVFSAIATLIAAHSWGAVASLEAHGLGMRLLNAANNVVFYLSKLLLPVGLSPFYSLQSGSSGDWMLGLIANTAIVLLISVLTIFAWRRKQPFWLIAWSFYLVTLLPVIGIVQVGSQAAADRFAYLPTLPFYLIAGSGLAYWLTGKRLSKLLRGALVLATVILITLLTGKARSQTDVWENDITLWRQVVMLDPQSSFGHYKLGDAFMAWSQPEMAVAAYLTALRLNPERLWFGINLPSAYMALGHQQKAIEQLDILITNDVTDGRQLDLLYLQKAEAQLHLGHRAAARETLETALRLNPANTNVQNLLAELGLDD